MCCKNKYELDLIWWVIISHTLICKIPQINLDTHSTQSCDIFKIMSLLSDILGLCCFLCPYFKNCSVIIISSLSTENIQCIQLSQFLGWNDGSVLKSTLQRAWFTKACNSSFKGICCLWPLKASVFKCTQLYTHT